MEELKEKCMALSVAELQHLLFHIQKHREDVLVLLTFTKEYFDMSKETFKGFKEFLLYGEDGINIQEVLKEVFMMMKDEQTSSFTSDTCSENCMCASE